MIAYMIYDEYVETRPRNTNGFLLSWFYVLS